MDGGNQIYMNISPLWDGEDDRFDIKDVSEKEIKQFPNLKEIILMTSLENKDKLISTFEEVGIKADIL